MTAIERDLIDGCMDLLFQLPSGIDTEADESDQSPEDMTAHIGGLIYQRLKQLQEKA